MKYIQEQKDEFLRLSTGFLGDDKRPMDIIGNKPLSLCRAMDLIDIAGHYRKGTVVPVDHRKAIAIYEFIIKNRDSFGPLNLRELYYWLSVSYSEVGDTEEYMRYKALSGQIRTDRDYSILLDSMNFSDMRDIEEIIRFMVNCNASRYHMNKVISKILEHWDSIVYEDWKEYRLHLLLIEFSRVKNISDDNLERVYSIISKVMEKYDPEIDYNNCLATEIFKIMEMHDGIDKAIEWILSVVPKVHGDALLELMKPENYPTIESWKRSIERMRKTDGFEKRAISSISAPYWHYSLYSKELTDLLTVSIKDDPTIPSRSIRKYYDGDYKGFASDYLKYSQRDLRLDAYSCAILFNGLGTERHPNIMKEVVNEYRFDSIKIKKKLADAFDLTSDSYLDS